MSATDPAQSGGYTARVRDEPLVMLDLDPAVLARRLAELRVEHRDLDQAIARMVADPLSDELAIKRLKKRKLKLKDMIAYLESKLIPDQPA